MYKAFGSSKEIAQLKDESLAIGWVCKLFLSCIILKLKRCQNPGLRVINGL